MEAGLVPCLFLKVLEIKEPSHCTKIHHISMKHPLVSLS